ncbi:non-ribosomal peptide synthase/polyketide synthase [Cupriavidus pampae]|uniref:D-alanine--D-alanyl carrier protein ligase n=1 Tax=Cupriavidus pampae TaxID=659251 RepID=A0ABN7XSW6_9BURK|nr:non-ribosomal peptide synthase/polyketide synthase [Cupriavidus pampae]CAG9164010.1 D-alanine--D-alanyl carrier protein ligase [Cupriavidus pampae]
MALEAQQIARRVAALAPQARREFLKKLEAAGLSAAELPIVPADRSSTLPLSHAQRGMWLTWQLDPSSPAYNLPGALHLDGALDRDALLASLNQLVARHEILRTVYEAGVDGEPVQRVLAEALVDMPNHDLRDNAQSLQSELDAFCATPFQLDAAPPFRAALFHTGDNQHVLALAIHHIAADGWSIRIVIDELLGAYEAIVAGRPLTLSPLPPMPIQYADFAVWQRNWFDAGLLDRQLAYWTERLGDEHPPIDLPFDHARHANPTQHADALLAEGRHMVKLPVALSDQLRAFAREQGASLFMVMLALFKVTLHRYSGQADVRVGAPIASRQKAETLGLVGCLLNVQVLRTQLDVGQGFAALLASVRDTVLDAQAHPDLPFEALVDALQPERQAGVHPLFQVKCTQQEDRPSTLTAGGLQIRVQELSGGRAHFDLSFDFTDRGNGGNGGDGGDGIEGVLAYAAARFDEATIARFARALVGIAEQAMQAPELPLVAYRVPGAQPMLCGPTESFPAHDLLALWDNAVRTVPQRDAVRHEDLHFSYAMLDAHANSLASALRARGVGTEARVGIFADRSCEFVLGVLAVLKAGATYVPLDPQLPAERLAYQLENSGAALLLAAQTPPWQVVVPVMALGFEASPSAVAGSWPAVDANQAAYIIYTSGSTGQPKGVTVTRGALTNYVQAVLQRMELPAEAKSLAMVSTVAADLGHTSFFGALCSGRTLHLIARERAFDPDRFGAYMAEHRIDALKIVPSHLQALLQAATPANVLPRRLLVVGGEATHWELPDRIRALRPECRVMNHYGPSETTVGVLTQPAADAGRVVASLPIGRPMANIQAMVLDADLNPVPQGVAGELYLSGAGLARGYAARPGQTAERFVAHPQYPGARMYRTGDKVRLLGDGSIAFLGRVDDQIKIRGYRVEPGEVRRAILMLPGVSAAEVLPMAASDGAEGDANRIMLCAYVVGEDAEATRIRASLSALLPDYMVPASIVRLDALPLNANGKIDRKALPQPARDSGTTYEAPCNAFEQTLADIWAELLGVERVGRTDNVFALGADSILSLKVVARARKQGIKVLPRQLLEHQTLADLSRVLQPEAAVAATSAQAPIPRLADRSAARPLSHAQTRQWFVWQMDPHSTAHHIAGGLRLRGRLDVAALRASLAAVVQRHEALRTVIEADAEGMPLQRVREEVVFDLTTYDAVDLIAANAEAARIALTPFALDGGTLIRAGLIRLADNDHILVVVMHHIISDGWSMRLIVDEFVQRYRAELGESVPSLPPLALHYADYAVWQRQWLEDGEQARQLGYWTTQLGDEHPVLQLPTDAPRRAADGYREARHEATLPRDLVQALSRTAQANGATLFMTLLTAFQALLSRYTAQGDIRVGVPIANRHRAETQDVVGFFVNTQVMRLQLGARTTLTEALAQTREAALGAQAHQDLPFEQLVEALQPERSLNHHPLFQVMFNHQRDSRAVLARLSGLTVEPHAVGEQAAQFELVLDSIEQDDGQLKLTLRYAAELFEPRTIAAMATHYEALVRALAERPETPVAEVPLLTASESTLLRDWSENTAVHEAVEPVHHQIERRVRARPDAVAVVFGDQSLTYAALNARANRLAHRLIAEGVRPDMPVGIIAERSLEMVVGLLAIMKAGGAYVPIDPEYPRDRIAYMIESSGMTLLLGQPHLRQPGVAWLSLEDNDDSADHDPQVPLHAEHLAYVIFTSGSTGKPKGAANRHGALSNRIAWMQQAYALTAQDTVLQKTPFSFDVSVWEFFCPLMIGARLVVANPGDHRDPARLVALIRAHDVSTLHFVPSMLGAFMAHDGVEACTSLRRIVCSGEALPAEVQGQVLARLPRAALYNLYGPTEAAIDVTHWTCRDDGQSQVAIGQPISGIRTYVLDGSLNLTPRGVAGELYLGGIGLARGYLGRPALSAERFVADPFQTGERLYRTGDLVKWRADGQIEYLGRIDHQVKIRGLRIELGEIEAQLLAQPEVTEAVVVARDGTRLIAYVACCAPFDAETMRARLSSVLPDYMVPGALVVLERLPLNANGKIDRKALPEPQAQARAYEAPQGEVEQALAAVWAEVLGVERAGQIGRHDNFFERGGDSIVSLQIVSKARRAGWKITPRQMFERQTVAQLASVAEAVASGHAAPGYTAAQGEVPLLPFQAAFFQLDLPVRDHWNQAVLLRSAAPIEAGALARALSAVVEHHDALRMRFVQEGEVWKQTCVSAEMSAEMSDTTGLLWQRTAASIDDVPVLCNAAQRSLDIGRGQLLRALLIDVGGEQRLLLAIHHLAVDGVSWRILLDDLQHAYAQSTAGTPPAALALPARTANLQDWGNALRTYADRHGDELAYWQSLQTVPAALPCDHPDGAAIVATRRSVTLQLDRASTEALLRQAPAAYRTQINDILLTALGRALCAWTGQSSVLVDVEGHGREDLDHLDISRTVGWFTSLYPVALQPVGEIGHALRTVKECLRAVPGNGIGHGIFRAQGATLPRARVVFNYLGQFDTAFGEAWKPAAESAGDVMDGGAALMHDIAINGQVYDEVLQLTLHYSGARYLQDTMEALAEGFRHELEATIAHCLSGVQGVTPSDFPLARLTQSQLDRIAVPAATLQDLYPLSPMQSGMLFHSVYEADASGAYQGQLRVDIDGLDVARFRAGWQAAFDRHEILRSGFLPGDTPLQWVARQIEVPLVVHDGAADIDALALADRSKGFDLAQPPLMRLTLVRTGADRHHLIWTHHHLLLDGWSTSQLLGEVLSHYAGHTLPALTGRFRDYIAWLGQQDVGQSQTYWRERLAALDMPTRVAEALPQSTARAGYREYPRALDASQTAALTAFARTSRVTLNTLIQGAWALLLQRLTGHDTVCFGATTAGRPMQLTGADRMVGLFINTVPVLAQVHPGQPLSTWIAQLQAQGTASREHEYLPLHDIQRAAGAAGKGLFDTIIVFENYPIDEALARQDSGLRFHNVHSVNGNHYPLTLRVKTGDTLRFDYLHDLAHLDEAMAERVAGQFEALLLGMAAAGPQAVLGTLTHDTTNGPTGEAAPADWAADVLTLWRQSVQRTPTALSVADEMRQLTFAELDQLSDGLAHALRAHGVRHEMRVAVHAQRRVELVLGLLAALKAGAAYVPLDPALPQARLAYQIADSQAAIVLDAEDLSWAPDVPVLSLRQAWEVTAAATLPQTTHPHQAAYLIYTSGSTGQPKGVVVSHGALANYVQAVLRRMDLPEAARSMAMASTVGADLGHTVLFGALCSGRLLHLLAAERAFDPDRFADYMRRHEVDVLKIVPGHLHALLSAQRPQDVLPRHRLVVGGEATRWPLLDRIAELSPGTRVMNHYGPTETTVGILTQEAAEADRAAATLPVGRPLAGNAAYVLDAGLNAVPPGAAGELYLGGAGLARGYQGRAAQTAERFVASPTGNGERLYRTGDRVRVREDGSLEFLGRVDDQVKIRGYRVELGEVALALLALPGVGKAEVIARDAEDGRAQLYAYVVAKDGTALDTASLREQLASRLPEYMVPAAIVALDALPLNANGKVDRRALPEPTFQQADSFAAPEGEAEAAIAQVWAEVLRVERIGRYDNFFELGGDSILTLQIVARVRRRGWKLTPRQLMEGQTVAAVAAVATPVAAAPAAKTVETSDEWFPLTPVQRWFFAQQFANASHWNQSLMLESTAPADAALVRRAVAHVADHHDALRLRFAQCDGRWQQSIGPIGQLAFEHLDLRAAQDSAAAITEAASTAQRSLTLAQPFKAVWMDLGSSGRLLLAAHHLVVDGVSWRVIVEDLQAAFAQLESAQAVQLPGNGGVLRAWTVMLEAHANSETLRTELPYWQRTLAGDNTSLPAIAGGSNHVADAHALSVTLGATRTRQLLNEVPQAYRTQINDILLAALARTLCEWDGRESVLIELEGHGREELDNSRDNDGLDLSRTVGWFTTLFPVRIAPGNAGPGATIKAVKEQLRSVPRKGIGYGVLRYMTEAGNMLGDLGYPQVTFNYLGQFDQTFDTKGVWRAAREHAGVQRAADSARRTWFDIGAVVHDGQLSLSWSFSRALHDTATVQGLLDRFQSHLDALIAHCIDGAHGVTPSDFPLAQLSQDQLDALPMSAGTVADLYPLSPMQAGMLFHSLLEPEGTAYLNQLRFAFEGLDVERFRAAWQAVYAHHDVLRTGFLPGEPPLQWVARSVTLPLVELDWRGQGAAECEAGLEAHAAAELARGFDLSAPPLIRLVLIRTGDRTHHLIWTGHHLLLDGWSTSQLMGEVLRAYAGQPLQAQKGRYRDHIAWLQAQDADAARRFWSTQLARLQGNTHLAKALPLAAEAAHGKGLHTRALDDAATSALTQFARREHITLNTLVQGAWALLLQRYTGQASVAFGATVAGRPGELAGAQTMLGLFINTLPVVTAPAPGQRVGDWLRDVQAQNIASRDYEHTPLYEIQRWGGQSGQALFDSVLVFENYPVDQALREALPGGMQATVTHRRDETSYPMTVSAFADPTLTLQFGYDRALFDDATAARVADHTVRLLEALAQEGHHAVGAVAALSADEREQLTTWGSNDARATEIPLVHEAVQVHACLRPDALAVLVEDDAEGLDYRTLNRRANRVAHALIAQGVRADTRVGLAVPRSADMVVALLGILKAGAAYVPLDPNYPAERLAYMVEDSGIGWLITDSTVRDRLPRANLLDLDRLLEYPHEHDPDVAVHPDQLAYVIYTSGSTGRPKGVGISHAALAEHAQVSIGFFGLTAQDRMLQFATLNFDGFVEQLYPPLCAGAAVVLRGPQLWDSETFYQRLIQQRISVVDLTTAYWFLLVQDFARQGRRDYGALRQVHAGGEAMPPEGLRAWCEAGLDHVMLLNTYGPTEATVTATVLDCAPYVEGAPLPVQMPIGTPLSGRRVYVLDAQLQATPAGVAGELCIGGDLLARGYLGRAGLSAERFVADPFDADGGRLYRTGDLVRWTRAGELEYLGRIDHQVKIRGFRVELGEVEARLLAQPGVREAVALAQPAPGGGLRLVGYVSPQPGSTLDADVLRQALAAVLPEYMVPAPLMVLEKLPLNPNGKVDRHALPAADAVQTVSEPPQGEVEEALAAIWADVLGVSAVGRHDNFFALGGHSLAVLHTQSRVQRTLGGHLPLKAYFEHATLSRLAGVLQAHLTEGAATEAAGLNEIDDLLASLEN